MLCFIKELHLTEGRGTGFPTIYKGMEDNYSPPPIMETDDQCTYFLAVLPANLEFIGNIKSDQESDQESDQVSANERKILAYCKDPKSSVKILSKIGLSNHTTNYKRHIEPLLEKQWLRMTIPDKPKHRNQEYKTTETGEKKLKR